MKPIVFLSFLLTVHGIANVFEGSFSLNGIEYYYQGDSDPEISWYDAYWICKDNGRFLELRIDLSRSEDLKQHAVVQQHAR